MSNLKTVALGALGGVIGGAVIVGGYATFNHLTGNDGGVSGSNKKTEVSQVNYNVNSDTTKAVDKVKGAVVSVINMQKQSSSDDLMNQFGSLFGQDNNAAQDENANGSLETASEGSGVIYKKDGQYAYIVTNNHVVAGSDELQVMLNNGTKLKAKLIGTDEYTDLAVLRISSKDVKTVATFGNSNNIKVGEPAIAIGSPLGSDYANSVTEGIISAKNRTITTKSESGGNVSINAIQTDAAINPGNSGGPLINAAGQVIGINSVKIANSNESALASSGTSVEGMGFAIPSDDVVTIINQLEKSGKINRPALGVTMMDLTYVSPEQQSEVLKVPSSVKEGVVVGSVQSDSPAAKAGLKKYDVITQIGGKDIANSTDLQSQLYKKNIGDTIKITYYHEDQKKTADVKLTMSSSQLKTTKKSSEH